MNHRATMKNGSIPTLVVLALLGWASSRRGSFNKVKFLVKNQADGWRVLNHPDIVANFKKSLRWKPKHKTAILLPCAATKPFPDSPSHKHGYLPAIKGRKVDVFVVSEPLGIIPYDWSRKYPNDAYEYPPKHLKGKGKDLLIARFREWLEKVGSKYNQIELALPNHHMRLVKKAGEGLKLPFEDRSISACRKSKKCGKNVFRATNKEYKDFL